MDSRKRDTRASRKSANVLEYPKWESCETPKSHRSRAASLVGPLSRASHRFVERHFLSHGEHQNQSISVLFH